MPTIRESINSGEYHQKMAAHLTEPGSRTDHINSLNEFYGVASGHMRDKEWPNPLLRPTPKVLLLGTSSPATSQTFIKYVERRNPDPKIFIADLSLRPLQDCATEGLNKPTNVVAVQADATELPFSPNSLDLIETDALLQFLTPDEKKQTLQECARVLTPGGVVTTRDWLLPDNATEADKQAYEKRRLTMQKQVGVLPEATTKKQLTQLLDDVGFDRSIKPDGYAYPGAFFHHIVIRK